MAKGKAREIYTAKPGRKAVAPAF